MTSHRFRSATLACLLCCVGLSACAQTQAPPQSPPTAANALPYDIAETGLNGRTLIADAAGQPDAAGTVDDPLSLQAAADQARPGDTVLVRGGTYTPQDEHVLVPDMAVLQINQGGTPEHWIRFANYPDETPVIRFQSLRGIKINGVSYLVIEGFEIDGRNDEVDPQAATEHAENFEGDDHTQTQFFGVGIRISTTEDVDPPLYSHHVIIRNNHIHHTAGGGIATARADYVLVENNRVHHTSFYTPWGGSGISIWQSANFDDRQDVYRTVIKDNVTYRNDNRVKFWMMDDFSDGNGIILDALHNSQENIIGDGYMKPYNGQVLVANNVSFLNGGRGINIYESDHVDAFHNTLVHNSQRHNQQNEIELGRTHHTRIHNNVIHVTPGQHAVGGYQSDHISIDHNLIHEGQPAKDFPYGKHVVTQPANFLTPPTLLKKEESAGSLVFDFQLQPDSPAIGQASPEFAFPLDKNGNPRPTDPPADLGAYQHTD